jgi:hypothetical protein
VPTNQTKIKLIEFLESFLRGCIIALDIPKPSKVKEDKTREKYPMIYYTEMQQPPRKTSVDREDEKLPNEESSVALKGNWIKSKYLTTEMPILKEIEDPSPSEKSELLNSNNTD